MVVVMPSQPDRHAADLVEIPDAGGIHDFNADRRCAQLIGRERRGRLAPAWSSKHLDWARARWNLVANSTG